MRLFGNRTMQNGTERNHCCLELLSSNYKLWLGRNADIWEEELYNTLQKHMYLMYDSRGGMGLRCG